MSRPAYDLAVIGGGTAGLTAATIAARVGARVVLVERDKLGGDCLHTGCVPSKALIRCARAAHDVRRAAAFGVRTAQPAVDAAAVRAHVHGAIAAIGRNDSQAALGARGVEVLSGAARLTAGGGLEVDGRRLDAARIVLASGSRPLRPTVPGADGPDVCTTDTLFDLDTLPERLVIVGGGPIGIEMGQAFARLGARVTILQRGPRILPRDDTETVDLLRVLLAEEFDLRCGTRLLAVERSDTGATTVVTEHGGSRERLECDRVLFATGRRPATDDLDLDAADVVHDAVGIRTDAGMRTSAARIWAAGDCAGPPFFTHRAELQARVAARNALFRGRSTTNGHICAWTTFSDPELAHAGLTERQAGERHGEVRVYRFPYADVDRAVCDGATAGLAKIVCTPRGAILGASLLGAGAGDAVNEVVLAMHGGVTLQRLGEATHVYPTLSRIVRRLSDQRFLDEGLPAAARLAARFRPRPAQASRPEVRDHGSA